ncbi:MAG: RIP metalloprotease RseP [Sulfuriferula sp.]
MTLLTTLLAFAVALGILIVVHEFGHYAAARLVGVKVLRFSVGFGKPLLLRHWGKDRTEWVIAGFPLGGYVKMLDEREGHVQEADRHRSFNRQSVGARMLILVAGPLANLLLAVLLYWGLFMHGIPGLKPVIGEPPAASVAAQAGLNDGDEISAINGEPVASWADLQWALLRQLPSQQPLSISLTDGETRMLNAAGVAVDGESDMAAKLGIRLFEPSLAAVIGQVLPDSVGSRAGLRPGDHIVAMDGTKISEWSDLVKLVRDRPGKVVTLQVERGSPAARLDIQLVPQRVEEAGVAVGKIGIGPKVDPAVFDAMLTKTRYGVATAFTKAFAKTWDTSVFSLQMMGRMVTGEVSWRNLSGPITIADYAGQSARTGTAAFVTFLALVSISLGVLNLLPIPLLDGGHLMYHIAELIKGSPVSERVMEIGQQIGMALLLTLMIFAFYNDISRLFTG